MRFLFYSVFIFKNPHKLFSLLCLHSCTFRIQKATESLKSFRPAAESSFEDFVVDTAKQEQILSDLSFYSNGKLHS